MPWGRSKYRPQGQKATGAVFRMRHALPPVRARTEDSQELLLRQAARHKTAMTILSGVPGSLVFLGDESRAGLSARERNIPALASVSRLTHHITDSLGTMDLLARNFCINLGFFPSQVSNDENGPTLSPRNSFHHNSSAFPKRRGKDSTPTKQNWQKR